MHVVESVDRRASWPRLAQPPARPNCTSRMQLDVLAKPATRAANPAAATLHLLVLTTTKLHPTMAQVSRLYRRSCSLQQADSFIPQTVR